MELSYLGLDDLQRLYQDNIVGAATKLIGFIFATVYALYQLAIYLDVPLLAPQELLWNALVRIVPARLLLDPARRQELEANNMLNQTHAAKSEALRKVFGVGGSTLLQGLPSIPGEGIMRRASMFVPQSKKVTSDVPPGLGNWDNSCYQNSVLQGLAALESVPPFLASSSDSPKEKDSTGRNLSELVAKLQDPENNGRHIWTPAKLKNMSSWQQQDAQEYFSKIMDELDKEAAKGAALEEGKAGLKDAVRDHAVTEDGAKNEATPEDGQQVARRMNPLEGLLAQRVACTRCGFTEGLSMIPFNCLTVPLGSAASYDVGDCLNDYTGLEEISDVECAKCTLLKTDAHLKKMLGKPQVPTPESPEFTSQPEQLSALPPEVREMVAKRLQAVENALRNDDFADKTLTEACQISKKAHVSSTKTRQAVVGRAPRGLAIHINRSVFDEWTGAQRKNHAAVRYPAVLDLRPWMLGGGQLKNGSDEALEAWQTDAKTSMLGGVDTDSHDHPYNYNLKAVVTHYGRHENGHYICYRKHAVHLAPQEGKEVESSGEEENASSKTTDRWWRLSDEDVSPVSEEDVLGQGGVFMLFYERAVPERPRPIEGVANAGDAVISSGPKEQFATNNGTKGEARAFSQVNSKSCNVSSSPRASSVRFAEASGNEVSDSGVFTSGTTTDGESEADEQASQPSKPVTAPAMRTSQAGAKGKGQVKSRADSTGLAGSFRPMAAT